MAALVRFSSKSVNLMASVPEAKHEDLIKDDESWFSGKDEENPSSADETTSNSGIAKKENRMVRYSKAMVLLVIVVVAAIIGSITYAFVRGQEQKTYQRHFTEVSSELVTFSQSRAREIFDNLEALSAHVTSIAAMENMVWPWVVIPDWQVVGVISNKMTGASTLTINPIVYEEDRVAWENFTASHYEDWLAEGHMYDDEVHPSLYSDERYEIARKGNINRTTDRIDTPSYNRTGTKKDERNRTSTGGSSWGNKANAERRWNVTGIRPYIWEMDYKAYREAIAAVSENETRPKRWDFIGPAKRAQFYLPRWQRAPVPDFRPGVNENFASKSIFRSVVRGMFETDRPVLSEVVEAGFLDNNYDKRFDPTTQMEPHSYLLQPIYDTLKKGRKPVGVLSAFFRWGKFFEEVLPQNEEGIIIVLSGSCGQIFTYELKGKKAFYLGQGELFNYTDKHMAVEFEVAPFAKLEETGENKYCQYSVQIFPSEQFKQDFFTNDPYYFMLVVIACFMATTVVFVIYDVMVTLRNNRIMDTAEKTTAVVNSLFPSNVRDRIMEDAATNDEKKRESKRTAFLATPGRQSGIAGYSPSEAIFGSKPIADLFPEATIMFGDLVGFTSWCSAREPCQVFSLLETLYYAFDTEAKRRRIFKVETIGDCYVAVCGVPTPRKKHAVVMARFASTCASKMIDVCRELEVTLGPDTSDLRMRVGLHSGPVTAGVLRGDKGRFQLFGDTMNTASRMESTGQANKVQISQATADLLVAAGKEKWLTPREGGVEAKGKGNLATFFLDITDSSIETGSVTVSTTSLESDPLSSSFFLGRHSGHARNHESVQGFNMGNPFNDRLIKWNVELLSKHLRQVMASAASKSLTRKTKDPASQSLRKRGSSGKLLAQNGTILDGVQQVLALPKFDPKVETSRVDPDSIQLSERVTLQLTSYVANVANLYKDNPFHNFEHASHVVQSVSKLLSRIVQPSDDKVAKTLHNHTFGISDPLTQFACVLSSLIHDAEHDGVPNSTLVAEKDPLSAKYDGRSVAEQNSLEVCWNLLMEPEYAELRGCIYSTEEDLERFRQTLVCMVLATDIMDKDLGKLRKERWAQAFSKEAVPGRDEEIANRKATIVLEHLIQASDVSHCMQHWHVFKKWNQALFTEMYVAYKQGRAEKDPSLAWYEGEIGFFDHYILPLANKLEACGVFGVSSHEYRSYAEANRQEWAEKGRDIVQEYIANIQASDAPRGVLVELDPSSKRTFEV